MNSQSSQMLGSFSVTTTGKHLSFPDNRPPVKDCQTLGILWLDPAFGMAPHLHGLVAVVPAWHFDAEADVPGPGEVELRSWTGWVP